MTPSRFDNVSVLSKANIYFDGKVVSHTILLPGDKKKTIGLIYPGEFKFNTDAAEKMEIVAGNCRVQQANAKDWKNYGPGEAFDVPAKSHFTIAVEKDVAEYVCSFLP